jgi:hypothetical protein
MTNEKLTVGALVAIFVFLMAFSTIVSYATVDTMTAEVTYKERVVKDDQSKYLVFTNTETLENSDSLAHFKFISSDIYGSLDVGCVYQFTVTGFRAPALSMYRNILEAEKQFCTE